jgi:ribosomal protein S18 acetylase RimI-like enzyme
MEHVLDNPAWNALLTGNSHLAHGNEQVKYFDKEVSPFVGLKEITTDNLLLLHELIDDSPRLLVSPTEVEIPTPLKFLYSINGYQMVFNNSLNSNNSPSQTTQLTAKDVPQMLALTQLTNPGPFASRTLEFGHYEGIFEGDKLVAMAGQRLHALPFAEVSAVCTHPNHLGQGYAKQLLIKQINRIQAANQTPYLHVKNTNDRAISVYESLGFAKRIPVFFYVIQRDK